MQIEISLSTVEDDAQCTKCGGELDTGGECTKCGYDNNPAFNKSKELKPTEKPDAPVDQQDRPNLAGMNLRPPEVSMNPEVSASTKGNDNEDE